MKKEMNQISNSLLWEFDYGLYVHMVSLNLFLAILVHFCFIYRYILSV